MIFNKNCKLSGHSEYPVSILLSPPLTESFELTLARALDLKKSGVPIKVLYCDGKVMGCVANPFLQKALCNHCRNVRTIAFKEYFSNEDVIALDSFYPVQVEEFKPIEEKLMKRLDDIMYGVESTILTFYRVDIKNLRNKWDVRTPFFFTMSNNFNEYSLFVFRCLANYLAKTHSQKIEFFNGRIVPTKAALCAAIDSGANFSVIEVSGAEKSLFMSHNKSVHDLDYLKERIKLYMASNRVNEELGNQFFVQRRTGIKTNDPTFIKNQKQGYFDYDDKQNIIAIFTSSPDELQISGDQWFTNASKDPSSFIISLRALLPENYIIVVRMHPNQQGDRTGNSKEMIAKLSGIKGVDLIKPLDPHSTYELIDISDYVLTFGSTVGLEATYWNKPSIQAGRSLWEDADVVYMVDTPDEVVDLLQKKPKPCSKEQAIKMGSYFMDTLDESKSLSWGDKGRYGFFADGKSYLKFKRKSIAYYASRIFDKILRFTW